ncbi:hypothetical protein JCM3774_006221 [Rhodotorula dairenensis]
MSWLRSWWTTSSPRTEPIKDQAVATDERITALQLEWTRLQERSHAESDAILAKLVDENSNLRLELEATERELKDVKAGRREDEVELRALKNEVLRLTSGKSALCVAVLDLQEDFFSPHILHSFKPGIAAFEAISLRMRAAVQDFAPGSSNQLCQTCLVFIFWRRNELFVRRCVASGLFGSFSHFNAFLADLKTAHPLLALYVSDASSDSIWQRQEAYAATFARAVSCGCLLLGRWALDSRLLESVDPSRTGLEQPLSSNILFVEPMVGQYVPPPLRQRGLRFVRLPRVIRAYPLRPSDPVATTSQLNYTKPLWQQDPPLCLDYYLNGRRCLDEQCHFSHAYRLHPEVTESLRYEVSRQPCPLLASGRSCPEAAGPCHFAHLCTRDPFCSKEDCRFPEWMHSRPEIVRPREVHLAEPALTAAPPVPSPHPRPFFSSASGLGSPPFCSAGGPIRPDTADLTDAELAELINKARREEAEYERGLAEDPFVTRAGRDRRGDF